MMTEEYSATEICRLCTLKSGEQMHIFEKDGEQRQLLLKIRACLPIIISKEDILPKNICNRCAYKLDMFYEFRLNCLNSETVLKHHSLKQISNGFPTGVKMDKMTEAQKVAYAEAMQQHMAQAAALHVKSEAEKGSCKEPGNHQNLNGVRLGEYPTTLKVPQITQPGADLYINNKPNPEPTFVIPDDGMGFDDGVRVLRALGTWSPDYATNPPRPGMLPLSEHLFGEGGHLLGGGVQRKVVPPPGAVKGKNAAVKGSSPGDSNTGNKSFACTVCGKGLARKDKLVIHMRIHTGEKPYVCEVCNKAFARRDKLVIHMNKMKHRTPSNVAPLGKRGNNADKVGERKQIKVEEKEPLCVASSSTAPQPQQPHAVTWNCELCGRMFSNREDWTVHAKGHLDDKMMGVVHHHQPAQHQSHTNSPAYFPQNVQSYPVGERHFCLVCRQDFGNKPDFMLHVRSHFEGKPPDLDVLTRSCGGNLVDTSGLCT